MKIAVAGGTGTVGRHVVEAAERAGHEAVVLSRSTGVDLSTGVGLDRALDDVEVIIDTVNTPRTSRAAATAFFVETTRRLQEAGAARGVERLVTLSIVGLERVPGFGYYQAKLEQEVAARGGPIPVSVVRATQFHEFPAQILARSQAGPLALVPRMRIQPIAARTVGEILVEVATGAARPQAVEVAGPEPADLVDLARALIARRGQRVAVIGFRVPGGAGKAMKGGALIPGAGVRLGGPTFAEWLDSADGGGSTLDVE